MPLLEQLRIYHHGMPPRTFAIAPQRFYVGRPMSGLVWLLTGGLFGVGWLIDVFLIPEFVEEVINIERACATSQRTPFPRGSLVIVSSAELTR